MHAKKHFWGLPYVAIVVIISLVRLAHADKSIAYPDSCLYRDWLQQDYGTNALSAFADENRNEMEYCVVGKVLKELNAGDVSTEALGNELARLSKERRIASDPAWRTLYLKTCGLRRRVRLSVLKAHAAQIIYTKQYPLGGTGNIHSTHVLTDEQYTKLGFMPRFAKHPGAQLCLLTLHDDGSISNEILVEKKFGFIRDPTLSFDAQTLAFSMRDNFTNDDFHLYLMNMVTRSIRQITFSPKMGNAVMTCSDIEPCFASNGRILFQSTRCVQIDPCGYEASGNLYSCDENGNDMMRLGFDQVSTHSPHLLDDGRVLYTRWEYNDRTPIYVQSLFTMNPDGTGQMAYYGNNSWFPTSLIQARGIPGTQKVMAIASGHHTLQKGKLVLIDHSKGTEGNSGVEFLAGSSPDGKPGRQPAHIPEPRSHDTSIDHFGQTGPQYRYPFPLDENNFLISFTTDGFQGVATFMPNDPDKEFPPFGIYWMNAKGDRELLAFDETASCGQAILLAARTPPPALPAQVDTRCRIGTFYVQNVYLGPGLAGVKPGVVKSLRVIALAYRSAWEGSGGNGGEAGGSCVQTPVGIDNSCWDVKHVLGEVDIEKDGSAYFEVPARVPVYFQILDAKGCCVQTMRSWATLMPGERFACLGCHENKSQANVAGVSAVTLAMGKKPQRLKSSFGVVHPLVAAVYAQNDKETRDDRLMGVQKPRNMDDLAATDGFGFHQRIQPILNKHCVRCHSGMNDPLEKKTDKYNLSDTTVDYCKDKKNVRLRGDNPQRRFTQGYITLTNNGKCTPLVNWYSPESRPQMLPPCHAGSTQSQIMEYLEPAHYNVQMSDAEKRTIACWIDLSVPFCGSYVEANLWSDEQEAEYKAYQQKRKFFAEQYWTE